MKKEIHDQPDLFKRGHGTIHLTIVEDNGVFETSEDFEYTCRHTRQRAYKQAEKYFQFYKELPNYELQFEPSS